MYNCIMSFFSDTFLSKTVLPKKHSYPFNEDFRRGYKNAWINSLKNCKP